MSGRSAWWAVFVLTLIYAISYIDRQMLSLLIGPIRQDLRISDTQIGLLTGFAFAAVYAVLGVPLGRIADTRNRVGLIAAGLTVWSLATAACGLARNFWQLFAARFGVGVGEAALTPAAYSLFSDYFEPRKLGRAISVYTLAQYFGMGAALVLGALLIGRLSSMRPLSLGAFGVLRPWQLAVVAVAVPGILALPLLRTVREPARRGGMTTGDVRWTAALVHLLRGWRYYVPHFTGFALAGLYAVGLTTWLPEFFRRTYGWPVQRTGVVLALVLIGVGAPSTLAGGWLADVLRARRLYAAPMWIAAFALLLLWPLSVLLPLARTAPEAIGLLVLVTAVLTFPTAVAPTALQLVTPNRMRAQVTAVFLLGNNLIGTGGGPLAVGLVTDVVFGRDAALRYSLATLGAVICPLAALALWLGRKPFAAAARAISAD